MSNRTSRESLAVQLFHAGHIRLWSRGNPDGWTLKSGLWSPFYVQLRNIGSKPPLLKAVADALGEALSDLDPQPTRLVGIAMAGVPLAVATSLSSGIPFAYTRTGTTGEKSKLASYGQHGMLEGDLVNGDVVALIDDVATLFTTKLEAKDIVVRHAQKMGVHVTCETVAVVIDREQGASSAAEEAGMNLHSLMRFETEALAWIGEELTQQENDIIRQYLQDPRAFQDPVARTRILGGQK